MSEKRITRLAATALTVVGTTLTTYCILNPDHGLDDGSLFFPIAAIIGVATLIAYRPRKKHAKN